MDLGEIVMALKDRRGETVSTANAKALEKFEQALTLLNGFFADPLAKIDEALAEDPDFVMGHCFRAGLMMISTEKGAEEALRAGIEAAERTGRANARERGHIAALRAWLAGDFQRAADLYGNLLIDHPRDLLALQLAHQCDFFLGQSMMLRDRIARVLPFWDESVPGYSYVLGMHAFGLEEMNDYRRAEETGRRALELEPRDPWAVHAVTHVMEMEGRTADGIAWLNGRRDDWAIENMFAFHNWWHLGLYHLDLGETARVFEVYDSGIRPNPSAVALEMVDASAMLWRMHLRGIDVRGRWGELADKWAVVAEDAYYGFNDAHAMMAFVADGRSADAKRLLSALTRRAEGGGTNAMMTRDVALPMSKAIHAFGEKRYGEAVDLLLAVRPVANRFGGSHAQRDIVHLTLIEAALRDGQAGLARAFAAERTALKPSSPFNWALTARSLSAAGDARGAALAENRARLLAA
jgi:tetratricopeptide (TPR) repeat protein